MLRLPLPQLSRKRWYMVGAGLLAAILLGVILGIFLRHRDTAVTCVGDTCVSDTKTDEEADQSFASPSPTPTPAPIFTNKLNGNVVAEGGEYLRPLAVMIENHQEARPQSGLNQADIVYEAIAEGGITRFMAVFADPRTSVRVGPVRSARPYYVDFATELGAFYAHVGGSAEALAQIAATKVYDLNQFGIGEPVFRRDFSRNVALEHTMYSSTDALWRYATETKKWPTAGDYTPWTFADTPARDTLPATQTVNISFSSADFAVEWRYNPETNLYTRFMAGKQHVNASDGAAIEASDIILQTVQRSHINEKTWKFTLTGQGKAVIVKNGIQVAATWKKTGTGRTVYYDSNNQEIPLTKGKIWVELVHPDTPFSIK